MSPECLELAQLSGRNRAESPGKHQRIPGICRASVLLPLQPLGLLWRSSRVIGDFIRAWHKRGRSLSVFSQQESCCEKTLLWALKSELQPIPAEGGGSHLLL